MRVCYNIGRFVVRCEVTTASNAAWEVLLLYYSTPFFGARTLRTAVTCKQRDHTSLDQKETRNSEAL